MKRIAMVVLACTMILGTVVGCTSLCCDPCKEDCNVCAPDPCGCP